MGAKNRVIQNLINATLTQKYSDNLAACRGNFLNIRAFAKTLFDIRGFKALYCGYRVVLRVARESPRADRCVLLYRE